MCEQCEIFKADLIPLVTAIQGDFSLCEGRESLQALDGTEEFPVLAGLLAARLAQMTGCEMERPGFAVLQEWAEITLVSMLETGQMIAVDITEIVHDYQQRAADIAKDN